MNLINPSLGKTLFPSILWRTNRPAIHLTFDDGPHPLATPKVLNVLRERKIKATFFLIGNNVRQYSEVVLQILADGHSIGNHTDNHPSLFCRSKNFQSEQIQRTNESIQKISGQQPIFFRPPYGYFDYTTLKAAKSLHQQVVMWSGDSLDFKDLPLDVIAQRVIVGAKAGSIFLFHDNHLTESKIGVLLPMVIDGMAQRGYQFEPLTPSCLN